MVMRKTIGFEKSISYHILSRAVDKKEIFVTENDCLRFIFQVHAANIGRPAFNLHRKDVIKVAQAVLEGEEISSKFIITEHSPLVYFLSFSLVIDHYHFNLVPDSENSIPKYMQKLNCGFARFYNLKHNRRGTLFESRYKIIPVRTSFQQDAVLRYVNVVNPLDVYQPGWREENLKNGEEALKFLNGYQFSSFPDLFGERSSKILAPQEVLEKYLGKAVTKNQKEYTRFLEQFLRDKSISASRIFLE